MKTKYNILKSCLVLLCSLIIAYIVFMLSFAQGIGVLHKDMFPAYIQPLNENETQLQKHPLLSAFFWNSDIVSHADELYLVINKTNDVLKVIEFKTMFSKVMFFTNIPLLLIILSAFCLPLYLSLRRKVKQVKTITHLNQQTEVLLAVFKISTSSHHQNSSSLNQLSHSLTLLNERVLNYQQETQTHICQDKLTGLADRHAYLAHLQEQLNDAEKNQAKKALLFIDLDGFKQVNDSFGHSFGDEVLIQVSERLRSVIRNHNLSHQHPTTMIELNLARLGGDEFSIFIESDTLAEHAVEVAQSVLFEVERDFVLGNKIIKIGASIGIAIFPDSASSAYALLQMADVAMYRAKTDGRGIFRVYSPEMGSNMRRYHYLLEELRLALASQNFTLSFQPIVHVEDCSIDYFEALVRWSHPIEGNISPAEFIPIAEESNLILELGDWILHEACRQMSAWYNAGMRKVRISVNVSAVQLKHRPIFNWVMATIDKVGLPAHALMLEITESCFIEASDVVIQELEKLRQAGVLIAIDDFGTGFSSLSTLAELPIDIIKIDKLFIDQANDNPKYNKILNSISELGKELDLKVVAEGIEHANQFELVKKLGIQCVQGYLVSRPETSRNVGNKVLSGNLNHIAATGTGVWLPETHKPFDLPSKRPL